MIVTIILFKLRERKCYTWKFTADRGNNILESQIRFCVDNYRKAINMQTHTQEQIQKTILSQ